MKYPELEIMKVRQIWLTPTNGDEETDANKPQPRIELFGGAAKLIVEVDVDGYHEEPHGVAVRLTTSTPYISAEIDSQIVVGGSLSLLCLRTLMITFRATSYQTILLKMSAGLRMPLPRA